MSDATESESKLEARQRSSESPIVAPNNVANAIVIKDEALFLLCERHGTIPHGNDQGFGLYYHDCRFLNGYELTVDGSRLNALEANSERGFMAQFVLTNPDLEGVAGSELKKQSVGIRWQRIIDASEISLHDVVTCTNYSVDPVEFVLSFSFSSDFEDIFEIRGMHPTKVGRKKSPEWKNDALVFEYNGADGLHRSIAISILPDPMARRQNGADVKLGLKPNESHAVHITFHLQESRSTQRLKLPTRSKEGTESLAFQLRQASDRWVEEHCAMQSSSATLNRVFERSLRDLMVLKTSLDGCEYFSAGLPWYGALFGRDSIISSLECLAFRPTVAEQTLRLLAKYQGKEINDWRDEEPGKIMHELRVGELAHLNEIPQTPYYGSVDSTPLFLILMARHANWTGDLSLFHELRDSIEQAFEWIKRFGDKSGNGYLEYSSKSKKGLGNQGWKDSGDSIVNADGTLAKPPIALVEVQGYVYLAKLSIAELYQRAGDEQAAERLRAEARELQKRFERDFWLEDKGIYALALQEGTRPAAVLSSNPGQMLWSGMARPDRAQKMIERLTSDSMFSGWGIRTLSTRERRYNPIGYHVGTVWPHDNSIIAAGFRVYGRDQEACAILQCITEAAQHFNHYRLPEVFAGFSRKEFNAPVRYPVACHPQAWAAGAVPFMLESLLGLVPKAFENRLQITRPSLPDCVSELELRRLRVGQSTVDLRFERKPDGTVKSKVIKIRGNLEIEVSSDQLDAAA